MTEDLTAKRLDDFRGEVGHRFDAVDQRFDAVDHRFDAVDHRFDAVDQRFKAVDHRFDAVDQRFDRVEVELHALRGEMSTEFAALHRLLIQFCGLMLAAVIGLLATQI